MKLWKWCLLGGPFIAAIVMLMGCSGVPVAQPYPVPVAQYQPVAPYTPKPVTPIPGDPPKVPQKGAATDSEYVGRLLEHVKTLTTHIQQLRALLAERDSRLAEAEAKVVELTTRVNELTATVNRLMLLPRKPDMPEPPTSTEKAAFWMMIAGGISIAAGICILVIPHLAWVREYGVPVVLVGLGLLLVGAFLDLVAQNPWILWVGGCVIAAGMAGAIWWSYRTKPTT